MLEDPHRATSELSPLPETRRESEGRRGGKRRRERRKERENHGSGERH
jgi:hypothetical protein